MFKIQTVLLSLLYCALNLGCNLEERDEAPESSKRLRVDAGPTGEGSDGERHGVDAGSAGEGAGGSAGVGGGSWGGEGGSGGEAWGAADAGAWNAEGGSGGGAWGVADAGAWNGAGGILGEDNGDGESSGTGGEAGGTEEGSAQPWQRRDGDQRFASVELGGGEQLLLNSMRITAQIESLRARTLVDHIFYNPHPQNLEGTFRYPLPPGASISYYAMFTGADEREPEFFGDGEALSALSAEEQAALEAKDWVEGADPQQWGELRVGRIVPAVRARQVYEEVTRRRVDPALLESVAPNTFEARVFPIPAHGYNRILVAYEETLPRLEDRRHYSFAIPAGEAAALEFKLLVSGEHESLGDLEVQEISPGLYGNQFAGHWEEGRFAFGFPVEDELEVIIGADPDRGRYFYGRLQAPLELDSSSQARPRAIFMLDTSLSSEPDRFNIDLALLISILSLNEGIEEFAVLSFDVGARWLTEGYVSNNPEQREALMERLSGVLLEGATDMGAALDALQDPRLQGGLVDLFLLTDGGLSWGELSVGELAARLESSTLNARFFAYRTGLGAENLALFAALTQNGATFNCLSEESVPTCAQAHTRPGIYLQSVEILGVGEQPAQVEELVIAGGQSTLFPGAELILAGRLLQSGEAEIRIRGLRGLEQLEYRWPVLLEGEGELAPRAWAEILVAQLLESRDESLEGLAVALAQRYQIIGRSTSLLVLESDEEYEIYDLEQRHAELENLPLTQLLREALELMGERLSGWAAVLDLLERYADLNQLSETLIDGFIAQAGEGALSLPESQLTIPLLSRDEVPHQYLEAMSHEPGVLGLYQEEADRRAAEGEIGAALRALSSLVENDPADPEALRMVGYRLRSWGASEAAAALFMEVLRRRPYEPQSYRDLAQSLSATRPALAALLYEAILAGRWDARFHQLKVVAREEYSLLIREWVRRAPEESLTLWLLSREEALGLLESEAELRVTMTWNTDNTDIDLWVTDPSGEKCFYAHPENIQGGQLLDDLTQGFGPERFEDQEADPGEYLVQAHYYGNNGNRLSAETQVHVMIIRYAGTEREEVTLHDVTLERPGDVANIARVRFP